MIKESLANKMSLSNIPDIISSIELLCALWTGLGQSVLFGSSLAPATRVLQMHWQWKLYTSIIRFPHLHYYTVEHDNGIFYLLVHLKNEEKLSWIKQEL